MKTDLSVPPLFKILEGHRAPRGHCHGDALAGVQARAAADRHYGVRVVLVIDLQAQRDVFIG